MIRRLLLGCCLLAPALARATEPDCVVLLHGLGLNAFAMQRLESALRADGYRTVNLSYPSRRMSFEQIADDYLPARLREHDVARAPRLHLVTHSMGSLVARRFLRRHRPANLGRVVMLGPPNHGSAAADRSSRNPLLRWFFGANLPRLGTGADAIAPTLGPADFELGIVAGNASINPLFDRALGGPHDGVVTVESARLEGMREFLVVPHSHTLMLWRAAVIDQVRAFLRDGAFTRSDPSANAPASTGR